MADEWNKPQPEDPADKSEEPSAPPSPDGFQPPLNGWSSDGSYRYVPPRNDQPADPPTTPPYTPPTQNPPPTYPTQSNPYGWNNATPPPRPPRKKNNGWIVVVAIIGAIGVIGAIVCFGLASMNILGTTPDYSANEEEREDVPALEISKWDDDDGGLSTREVVNRNLDCTVVLTIYSKSTSFSFGQSSLTEAGAASGIVMTADGYVITNGHCVINETTGKPYDRIDVVTHDGKTYENAEIIGADTSTDLAVIKVKAKGLTAAKFGDSSELAVGDRIVALGNAAGLSWTATQGIVSALARDVYDDTGYAIKCLQVDAAINFGNSGGPLLNNQGLVVGINSSKIAANGYEGLGFSIPINEAKTIIDSLMKYGRVKGRVALGITGQSISSGMYNGFLIATIDDDSSLQGTDVAVGDLIVAVNDKEVVDYGTLRSELAQYRVGDSVKLSLLRSEGRTGRVSSFTVNVTLKEQTAD